MTNNHPSPDSLPPGLLDRVTAALPAPASCEHDEVRIITMAMPPAGAGGMQSAGVLYTLTFRKSIQADSLTWQLDRVELRPGSRSAD